ncbi:MAG: TIGR02450 family Trp-rich protein [Pseudomonadales bacterium]
MVTTINPKKLLNSKWSALKPENREKHFLVTEVEFDENGQVTRCVIEAIISKREQLIDWQSLKDTTTWQQGWK